jgi:hypothetical protein
MPQFCNAEADRLPSLDLKAVLLQIFHTQPDAPSIQIHLDDFDRHDISHADDLEGVVDVAIGQLADVHQPVLLDADVHEGTEVYHIAQITITMALPSHL